MAMTMTSALILYALVTTYLVSLLEHCSQLHQVTPKSFWLLLFSLLATVKFVKVLVHTFSYYVLSPRIPLRSSTKYRSSDVTVIVPTVGDFGEEFRNCINSILANKPARIIVAIVGSATKAVNVCRELCPKTIDVVSIDVADKRRQFLTAAGMVDTKIIGYADDHVFWPKTFLQSALMPFDDSKVGIVGTVKRVLRRRGNSILESFLNYIAVIYLERHNFECTATYNIDGGAFVISGRSALLRAVIVKNDEFHYQYLHEYSYFGKHGPMKVDDDNFITRYMVKNGWKTVFWNQPEAMMTTTLGISGINKFKGQLLRWARTTIRSNMVSMIDDRICWRTHPWTTLAMFMPAYFNIALIYDAALFLTLWMASGTEHFHVLTAVLTLSKLVKSLDHLGREPRDIGFWMGGVLFGYLHSLIKIYAMCTADNIEWSGRTGIQAEGKTEEEETNH